MFNLSSLASLQLLAPLHTWFSNKIVDSLKVWQILKNTWVFGIWVPGCLRRTDSQTGTETGEARMCFAHTGESERTNQLEDAKWPPQHMHMDGK